MNSPSIPFFSVLVPVYNSGAYLRQCLASVGNADDASVEVIIVDDGSTDDSLAVLDALAKGDPRIRVIRHETNRSLYEARRTAVASCKGSYVLFLDSDDQFAPDALSRLHMALQENPVDILAFSYRTLPFGTVTKPDSMDVGRAGVSALLREKNKAMPTLWNNAYRGDVLRSAYAKLQGGYVNMSEDAVQSVAIALEAKSVGVLKGDPIYLYRYDTGVSTSSDLTLEKFEKILQSRKTALALIRAFLKNFAPDLLPETEGMERDFLSQTIHEQIEVQLQEEAKDAAVLRLPEYFSSDLLLPHLHEMRTHFARVTAENPWFSFAKKADAVTNALFPPGTIRRKVAAFLVACVIFLPKMLLCLLRWGYRLFRPHPDDLRKKQLGKGK